MLVSSAAYVLLKEMHELVLSVLFHFFYRFVRFVSTPEVLERIVTIEKEIVQIESQSNEKSNLVAEAEGMDVKS